MTQRRNRIRVVLDTNVLIGYYLSTNLLSANARVIRLWRDERRLQLVVSEAVLSEYLEVLRRLSVAEPRILRLSERLRRRGTVTHVNLGARPAASRDPDDDVMLATAMAGKAAFLLTNDNDLLEIPIEARRRFRFEIVTPAQFLERNAF